MSSIVGLTSRLSRIVGIFVVSLVAVIPLLSLANEAEKFLQPAGMSIVTAEWFAHMLVFGSTYAAIGEMLTSLTFSIVFMQLMKHLFTSNDGEAMRPFVKPDVIRSVQKNVFSYTIETPPPPAAA